MNQEVQIQSLYQLITATRLIEWLKKTHKKEANTGGIVTVRS